MVGFSFCGCVSVPCRGLVVFRVFLVSIRFSRCFSFRPLSGISGIQSLTTAALQEQPVWVSVPCRGLVVFRAIQGAMATQASEVSVPCRGLVVFRDGADDSTNGLW